LGRGVLRVVPPLRNWERLVAVMRSKHEPLNEEFVVRFDNGDHMIINPSDYVGFRIYMCGFYEPETVKLMRSLLKPGMTFFDIGAHFGQYTLVAARELGVSGRVHTFEPGPIQFSYLTRNVDLNKFRNVTLNNIALGDHEGTIGFVIDSEGNLGGSHIATTGENSTIETTLTTLDIYCANNKIDNIDVMKVDVEGAELPLFKGATAVLSKTPPKYIFYEAIEGLSQKFGYSVGDLHAFLASFGYKVHAVENGNLVPVGPDRWHLHPDFVAIR
jgi:FkbM family methyltransferase